MAAKVTWIFLFLSGYWVYCIACGVWGARQARGAADYFIVGRQLPAIPFILAATATSFSALTYLGHPGLVYVHGLPFAHTALYPITIAFTGLLFLKRQWILGHHFGFITPGEMFAYYFQSNLLRLLVVGVALMFSVPYVGLQLLASGFLFSVLTDGWVSPSFGMWLLASLVAGYVATGGLRSAAHADLLQAGLLATGLVVVGLLALSAVGGWERLMAGIAVLARDDPIRTPEGYSHYLAIPGVLQLVRDGTTAQGSPWTAAMILTYLFATMGIQASPAFTMWAFASRTPAPFAPQQVWISSFIMGLILIVLSTIAGFSGHFLGADRAFLAVHPDLVHPVLVDRLQGQDLMDIPGRQDRLVTQLIGLVEHSAPWLVGFLAVCALAAMESTASCYMATVGGILTRDLFRPHLMPHAGDAAEKLVGRLSILVIVLLALLVATAATDALILLGILTISYGLQMVPALTAVCYWPFLTRQGVTLGLITGLIVVTLTDALGPAWLGLTVWGRWPLTIHAAGWGIAANFVVAIAVSLVTTDDRRRKAEVHAVLRQHAALPEAQRRLVPWGWGVAMLWFGMAAGPGAILGNTLFGHPNRPDTWLFGMPSLWAWQILWWALGVGMMWFLAYRLEMATVSARPTILGPDSFWNRVRRRAAKPISR